MFKFSNIMKSPVKFSLLVAAIAIGAVLAFSYISKKVKEAQANASATTTTPEAETTTNSLRLNPNNATQVRSTANGTGGQINSFARVS